MQMVGNNFQKIYQLRGPHSNERQARSPYPMVRFQHSRKNSRESTYLRSRKPIVSQGTETPVHIAGITTHHTSEKGQHRETV